MHKPVWTARRVANRIRQAVLTLKKLPSAQVQAYSSAWPEVLRSPYEVDGMEAIPLQIAATPEEIAELDEVFTWMHWLTVDERKLVWKRAAHVRWRIICFELGVSKTNAWTNWKAALIKVALQLNKIIMKPLEEKNDGINRRKTLSD